MSQGIRCPDCGAVSASGETFCTACGARLPVAPPPTPSYSYGPPPPSGDVSGLVMFLRGSRLLVGLALLELALLLYACGGLSIFVLDIDVTMGSAEMANIGAAAACCLSGTLLAIIGVLIVLFSLESGASDLVMLLRAGGLTVGISILIVALLLCGYGGLVMDDPYRLKSLAAVLVQGDPTKGARQIQPCVTILCCVPGALLAVVGVLIALFPFAFGRGK